MNEFVSPVSYLALYLWDRDPLRPNRMRFVERQRFDQYTELQDYLEMVRSQRDIVQYKIKTVYEYHGEFWKDGGVE